MPAGNAYDGRCRLYILDEAPADPEGPTLVELAAGSHLSGYVPPDGISYNIGNARVSGADLLSSFDAEAMGRHQAAPSVKFKQKLVTGETEAWDELNERHRVVTLVCFEDIDEDAEIVDGDACFVFTSCQIGQPVPQNTATNTERQFQVDFAVGGRPYLNAVVGGGS